jgi:hypothetical protein
VELKEMFNMYLEAANCTDLACLRAAPVEVLVQADEAMVWDKNRSEGWIGPSIGFGPHPDGSLVPNAPDLLIREGKYHRDVQRVLMAHMWHDGNGVVSEYIPRVASTLRLTREQISTNSRIGETS